jgi:hypothetical protein
MSFLQAQRATRRGGHRLARAGRTRRVVVHV